MQQDWEYKAKAMVMNISSVAASGGGASDSKYVLPEMGKNSLESRNEAIDLT